MSTLNFDRTKRLLDAFDWPTLFIEELGWLSPTPTEERPLVIEAQGNSCSLKQIAHLGAVVVFEVEAFDTKIPGAKVRAALHRAIESRHREHLLIFMDHRRNQTVWSYPKYDDKQLRIRSHHFIKGQPADLFLSKLAGITFDLGDLDEAGNASLLDVTRRLRDALDVEQVTRRFYGSFKNQQDALAERHIYGIEAERMRRHYASVFLTRLMFVYFLQKKSFLDPSFGGGSSPYVKGRYLQEKFEEHKKYIRGIVDPPSFYTRFLGPLFFQGFATRASERSAEINALLGDVRYLNGGLFLEHPIEESHPNLDVDDAAVDGILQVFGDFSWHLDDTPGGKADEINPDVLGYILEKYVNQKAFGAYYTPPEITSYLCDATIDRYLVEALSDDPAASAALGLPHRRFDSLASLLTSLDDNLACRLLDELSNLTILDPAVGSGAFLVAALKKLLIIYRALLGHAELSKDLRLKRWLKEAKKHPSSGYFLKKEAITRNLFGVDIMPEAVEIAKLRLFLALVASAEKPDDLEPLPNIDFNLLDGNSLIGLLDVNEDRFIGDMFAAEGFRSRLEEKNRLVDQYRGFLQEVDPYDESGALLQVRDRILAARQQAQGVLNEALRLEMKDLGVEVEEADWNGKKETWTERPVHLEDVNALQPFHWAYEFSRIMERGGFKVIVTNPPWDVLEPHAKEFFSEHSNVVTKNRMDLNDFEEEKQILLENAEIRDVWLTYLSRFGHQKSYFKLSDTYRFQSPKLDGKTVPTKTNLYRLFLERCVHLLGDSGHCGVVVPSGLYSDLSAKGLREMLFDHTNVTGIFGFENRKLIFEDVDSRFKFAILTFENGGPTTSFPAAFMRHDPHELSRFPDEGSILITAESIKSFSPASLSIMELKSEMDRDLIEKLASFHSLGYGDWAFEQVYGFNMTTKKKLFKAQPNETRLPLIEGKMIHQFTDAFEEPRWWIDEQEGRQAISGRGSDDGQHLRYQHYRLGYRRVARNTDTRTLHAAILRRNSFAAESITLCTNSYTNSELLFLCGLMNSFIVDFMLRQSVSANVSQYFVSQLPVPRLGPSDPRFRPIVVRTARLVCTTAHFNALAAELGLDSQDEGVTDPKERARTRAELDGLVAHLYGLTEEEFAHILFDESITGFSRVTRAIRVDAQNAYREIARDRIESGRKVDDAEAARLVAAGESDCVEFKSTLRRNLHTGQNDPQIEESVLKTLAAFLNSVGGTLLVGVDDDGQPLGLDADNFPNEDKLVLHLTNLVRDRMTPLALPRLDMRPVWLKGERILKVTVHPAGEPVYVRDRKGNEAFYIRTGPSTTALSHSDTVAYVRKHYAA